MKIEPIVVAVFVATLLSAGTIAADDQRNYARFKDNELKNLSLGIAPVFVSDKIALNQLWINLDAQQRKQEFVSRLYRYAPAHVKTVAIFDTTEICTSASFGSLATRTFAFVNGKTVDMLLPPDEELYAFRQELDCVLFLFIDFIYDDRDSTCLSWKNLGILGPIPSVGEHPVEECLNYGCRYAIWSRAKKKFVSVGAATAEGCGRPGSRFSEQGALFVSTEELIKQVFDESPFFGILDASDFR